MKFTLFARQAVSALLIAVFTLVNSGASSVLYADATARSKYVAKCVDAFLGDLPADIRARTFMVPDSESLKQPAWLENDIMTELVSTNTAIAQANADYAINYKLIEDKKDYVKIAFRLIDAKTEKLVSYKTVTAGDQMQTAFDYEHKVAPKPVVKESGTRWGLLVLLGIIVAGVALTSKI